MGVPGNANALLLRSAAAAGGYQVSRSLRFNSSDSAFLSRTPGSAGNRRTWTWAGWVKRSSLSTGLDVNLFTGGVTNSDTGFIGVYIDNNHKLTVAGATTNFLVSNSVYRDVSAWYHIIAAFDATQGTNANKIKLYVNGDLLTNFAIDNRASISNQDYGINQAAAHAIGRSSLNGARYFDGYLADIYFIDGQALDPSSFTEVSATTGQLIPKQYTGSFGTNGFWLKFSDNSAATATTLGKDYSGNNNNWTPTNLAVANFRSATLTKTGGAIQTLQDAANAFDGILSTAFFCEPSNPSSLTLTLATGQAFSTLEINGYVQSSSKIVINGVDVSSQLLGDPNVYRTITGVTSPFTTLYMEVTGSASIPVIRDMRFNGVSPGWIFTGSDPRSDSLVDTPTSYGTNTGAGGEVRGNYATMNPLANGGTLANGNLDFSTGAAHGNSKSTIAIPASGKWYIESTVLSSTNGSVSAGIGLATGALSPTAVASSASNSWNVYGYSSLIFNRNDGGVTATGSFSAGDVLQLAVDPANNRAWVGRNNVWYDGSNGTTGNPATGSNPTFTSLPADLFVVANTYSNKVQLNFGQRAWAYTPPANYQPLVDTLLPTPVVAKPSTVMDVIRYTGTGANATIPNVNTVPTSIDFTPDLVWIKGRSGATDHALYDSVRDVQKDLASNSTAAETTQSTSLTAFGTNTFTIGSLAKLNTSSATYAAWCWDAGTTTDPNNTAGSITSSVRANASAGFSVATFNTGSSGVKTVGHGLNVAPSFFVIKSRSISGQWAIYHASLGYTQYMLLHSTSAAITDSGQWVASPTSSVFSFNSGYSTGANVDYVGYFWAPVAGYSSFGSYTGNGSADGPFVYTGFRPRFLLIKYSSGVNSWMMQDSARDTYNPCPLNLTANGSGAENDYKSSLPNDMLSNGFKLRNTNDAWNGSGGTYIYAAFAESPFQFSRAR